MERGVCRSLALDEKLVTCGRDVLYLLCYAQAHTRRLMGE